VKIRPVIQTGFAGCFILGLLGCTQNSPPAASQNTPGKAVVGGGPDGGLRGLGRDRGLPNLSTPSERFFVERATLYSGQSEPSATDQLDTLFLYLLIRPAANQEKRIEALRAYTCYVPSPGTSPSQSTRAVFLVPARSIGGANLHEQDPNKLFQELSTDGYNYDLANQLIWEVGRWSNETPDMRGIFVVEVDRPIPSGPSRGRAYNLAGLPANIIKNWIVNEISNVESGWNAEMLPEIRRATPSWSDVISSVDDIFRIVPASNANPLPISCP
jgi:hypothetical protein